MKKKAINNLIEDLKELEKHNIKTITISTGFISKSKEEDKKLKLEKLPKRK